MVCFDLEKLLALVDKDQRKSKEGITFGIDNPYQRFPQIYHLESLDSFPDDLEYLLYLDPTHIIYTAIDCSDIPDEIIEESSEKDLIEHLKKMSPSDLDLVYELEGKVISRKSTKYFFMTERDASRFQEALSKIVSENLQKELKIREEKGESIFKGPLL